MSGKFSARIDLTQIDQIAPSTKIRYLKYQTFFGNSYVQICLQVSS